MTFGPSYAVFEEKQSDEERKEMKKSDLWMEEARGEDAGVCDSRLSLALPTHAQTNLDLLLLTFIADYDSLHLVNHGEGTIPARAGPNISFLQFAFV